MEILGKLFGIELIEFGRKKYIKERKLVRIILKENLIPILDYWI